MVRLRGYPGAYRLDALAILLAVIPIFTISRANNCVKSDLGLLISDKHSVRRGQITFSISALYQGTRDNARITPLSRTCV